MVASNQSTSYKLAKFSGYDTACYWKSLMFDVLQDNKLAVLTKVIVNFEQLAANARVDLSLVNNKGTIVFTDTISNTKLGAATNYHMPLNISTENFRIQFDYTNGNTTNPVKIKNVLIYGRDS
jgi:hypothetical protein